MGNICAICSKEIGLGQDHPVELIDIDGHFFKICCKCLNKYRCCSSSATYLQDHRVYCDYHWNGGYPDDHTNPSCIIGWKTFSVTLFIIFWPIFYFKNSLVFINKDI